MNDNDDDPYVLLERYVDRVLGPLRATSRRKTAVREELTAHLLDLFAQELQRAGEPHAALDATIRRFGDCDVLATELEASVPRLERMASLILNKEQLMWRLLVGIGLFVTLLGTSVVLPALAKLKHFASLNGNGDVLMMLAVGLIVGVTGVVVGVHLLGWGIARRVWKTA